MVLLTWYDVNETEQNRLYQLILYMQVADVSLLGAIFFTIGELPKWIQIKAS